MSEESFVFHSAPTLAGIKTGSLFTTQFQRKESAIAGIRKLNIALTPKGIRVIPLRERNGDILIYVYRPNNLEQDFHNQQLLALLEQRGYPTEHPDRCVVWLKKRLRESEDFPHEIGLFLGYPPEDVRGFIENKAKNYKACGTWKVYGDEGEAKKRFERFKQCTRNYCSRIEQGYTIENLAVSL